MPIGTCTQLLVKPVTVCCSAERHHYAEAQETVCIFWQYMCVRSRV